MHTFVAILVSSSIITAELFQFNIPNGSLIFIFALGVAVVGLPHGGMDQKIGLRLFSSFSTPIAWSLFIVSYLSVSAAIVAGWFLSPTLTVLVFFTLAAVHFGFEEEMRSRLSVWNACGAVARGGMVIWVPAVFQASATTELLAVVLPGSEIAVSAAIIDAIQWVAPVLAVILFIDLVSIIRSVGNQANETGGKRELYRYTPHRIAIFGLLFAVANPLISFGVYFCVWHSVLGLSHLKSEYHFSNSQLIRSLLPLSLAAVALFIIGFLFSASFNSIGSATIQTIFIGLSAVAIPHLLLHILFDWGRAGVGLQ